MTFLEPVFEDWDIDAAKGLKRRLQAMETLSKAVILMGTRLMPIIPFEENQTSAQPHPDPAPMYLPLQHGLSHIIDLFQFEFLGHQLVEFEVCPHGHID